MRFGRREASRRSRCVDVRRGVHEATRARMPRRKADRSSRRVRHARRLRTRARVLTCGNMHRLVHEVLSGHRESRRLARSHVRSRHRVVRPDRQMSVKLLNDVRVGQIIRFDESRFLWFNNDTRNLEITNKDMLLILDIYNKRAVRSSLQLLVLAKNHIGKVYVFLDDKIERIC